MPPDVHRMRLKECGPSKPNHDVVGLDSGGRRVRIGFVLCEHPLDVRIKKEARSLAKAGHQVFALLQERPTNQPVTGADAITVDSYPPLPSNGLQDALTFFRRMSFLPIPI